MSYTAITTATAGAHSVLMEAIKATGVIVYLAPKDFQNLIEKAENPLIVFAEVRGILGTSYTGYLTSYKGLAFYAKAKEPLHLPGNAEIIRAKKIRLPEIR